MTDAIPTPGKDRHTNRGGHNKINLEGRKFGRLTVVSDTGRRKSRRPIWKCLCACGAEPEILGKYLLHGDTRSCGCLKKEKAHNNKTVGVVTGSYFYHVKSNAKRRGIPFEISAAEASEVWERQEGKCALTGQPLQIVQNFRDDGKNQSASLDRIDNDLGYVASNIQWVHKVVNIMKNRLGEAEFIAWCELVVRHAQHK